LVGSMKGLRRKGVGGDFCGGARAWASTKRRGKRRGFSCERGCVGWENESGWVLGRLRPGSVEKSLALRSEGGGRKEKGENRKLAPFQKKNQNDPNLEGGGGSFKSA